MYKHTFTSKTFLQIYSRCFFSAVKGLCETNDASGDRDPITARELLNNVVWMSAAVEDKIQKKAIDVLANMLEIGDGGPIDESRARNLRARLKKGSLILAGKLCKNIVPSEIQKQTLKN